MAIVGLLWFALLTDCFNLEPDAGRMYSYPYNNTQERESYFGYSVALQHVESDNTDWWVARLSHFFSPHIYIIMSFAYSIPCSYDQLCDLYLFLFRLIFIYILIMS